MNCPRCHTENQIEARFCLHCGNPIPAHPQYEDTKRAPVRLNISSAMLIWLFLLFAAFLTYQASHAPNSRQIVSDNSTPAPTTAAPTATTGTDWQQTARDNSAASVENFLRENGCVECMAYATGTTFVIKNPNAAPKFTASLLLGNKPIKTALLDKGFTLLRVYQDKSFFGTYFEYAIR